MPSKRKIFLIDYENVASDWAEYISSMNASTRVLLFYSSVTPTIPTKVLAQILAKKIKLELIACVTGNNAMDFQLVTELGYRIGAASVSSQPQAMYYIVSRDKGFDAAVNYWTNKNVMVTRLAPIVGSHALAEKPDIQPIQAPPPTDMTATVKPVKPKQKTLAKNLQPLPEYISPLLDKTISAWRKRMTECVSTFGHIPPKPRQTLLHIMLTAPSIDPETREQELLDSIKTMVNKDTNYTGGRPWNKMLVLLKQLSNMENQQTH